MRARILCAAAICLLPVASSAQDGLRSASLPERPVRSRPSPELGDFFRADPDTYTPRRHLPNNYALPIFLFRSHRSLGDVYYMSPPPYGNVPCAGEVRGCPVSSSYDAGGRRDRHHAHRHEYVGRVPPGGPADPPPPATAPVAPPPVAAPGVPKTFYVIAGCYAGDKPPQPEWLAPDCDLSRVRVIPP